MLFILLYIHTIDFCYKIIRAITRFCIYIIVKLFQYLPILIHAIIHTNTNMNANALTLLPNAEFSFVENSDIRIENTMTDTESEYDSDDELDDIELAETEFDEADKEDGKYYLGVQFTFRSLQKIMMNCSISVPTFLTQEYSRVIEYLNSISSFYFHSDNQLDILQLHITDHAEYTVVIKTHWLRIVQRRWRKVFRQRNAIFAKRASVQNQEYFRTHGRYLPGSHTLPTIHGMLHDLSNKSKSVSRE